MTRACAALLFFAVAARADKVVIRVSAGDEPVVGAGVKVLKADEAIVFDRVKWKPDAETDDTGQAVVDIPENGRGLVYVPGFELAVLAAGGAVVDVELEPEQVVSGRIVDSAGEPLAGARIAVKTEFNRKAAFHATSDDQGAFFVYGLWFDEYTAVAEAAGYLPATEHLLAPGTAAVIRVLRPCTLGGKVVDPTGAPLAAVEVYVVGGPSARSGADGAWRIEGIRPGRFGLNVEPPYESEPYVLELTEGAMRTDLVLTVLVPATVRFRIVDEEDKACAEVRVLADGEYRAARPDGSFEFLHSPDEGATVLIEAKGRLSRELALPDLNPGAIYDLGSIVLMPLPRIEVHVREPDGSPAREGRLEYGGAIRDGVAIAHEEGTDYVHVDGYPRTAVDVRSPGPVYVTLAEPHWIEGILRGAPPGTTVSDHASYWVMTNSEGRFRIGPFAEGVVSLYARGQELRLRTGEGLVEWVLRDPQPALLRGRVLRGDEPVTRFEVEGERFVNPEGRFEVIVRRGLRRTVSVRAGHGRPLLFPLPAAGEELVARIPQATLEVRLEGADAYKKVLVSPPGYADVRKLETDGEGVARFDALPPGYYEVRAPGYRLARVEIGATGTTVVRLPVAATGTVRIRVRDRTVTRAWPAGRHGEWFELNGRNRIRVELAVAPGEERLVDLVPPDRGTVKGRGPPRSAAMLHSAGRADDVEVTVDLDVDEQGRIHATDVPPGVYRLSWGPHQQTLEVQPGAGAEVFLEPGAFAVEGQIQLDGGKPAQGALVEVFREGRLVGRDSTDPAGRFRLANLPSDTYRCVASLDGYATGSALVGEAVSELPIVLRPSAGSVVRILDPSGAPVPWLEARLDGYGRQANAVGEVPLDRPVSLLELELAGYATIRGLEVRDGDVVRLREGADLTIVTAEDAPPLTIRLNGKVWAADLQPARGRLRLTDLPAGAGEVVFPTPEDEGEDPRPPVPFDLAPGTETVIEALGE